MILLVGLYSSPIQGIATISVRKIKEAILALNASFFPHPRHILLLFL
jgi:hypothetical protein